MAGRIPQTFINDLIERVDIVDLIERRMTLKKSGKNYMGLCPFHDEKTPSFSVNPDRQFFYCFGCQEKGTALTFLMKYDRLEFVEAVETLAQQLGLEVPREHGSAPIERISPALYDVLDQAEHFYRQALKDAPVAVDYLKSRGLTGVVARDFGIGYAPDGWQNLHDALGGTREDDMLEAGLLTRSDNGRVYDRFRDRIMFPIRDTRGRVIGFGGRTLRSEDGPKYLNSPETPVFHKSQELYGLYEARRAVLRLDRLVVVEGYMDVVALAQFGVPNAVATLGTASGTPHFQKLFRHVDEVVCCFDGDNAGRQAAWKALESALPVLNEHRQLKFVFLPDGEDPDTLVREQGKAAFDQLLRNAMPAVEFLLSRLAQGLDLNSLDGRARFAGLAAPYVDKVPEGVLRALLDQRVKEMTGLQAPASPQQNVSAVTRRAQPARKQRVTGVSERLLTILFKRPELWRTVDGTVRSELIQAAPEESITHQVLTYLESHPDADGEELLVAFADGEDGESLVRLAEKPLPIDASTLGPELQDICAKYLHNIRAQQRREAVQALKENPNGDQLRKYWQYRGAGDDYSS